MSNATNPNTPTNPASLVVGTNGQAFAAITDNGNAITPTIAWSESSAGAVITIDPVAGTIVPVAPGTSTVTATVVVNTTAGTGTCLVTVTAQGDNLVVTVTVQ